MTNFASLALARRSQPRSAGRPVTKLAAALVLGAIVCLAGCQDSHGGDAQAAASTTTTTRAPMVGQPGYSYPSRATATTRAGACSATVSVTSWSRARTRPTAARAGTPRSRPPGFRAGSRRLLPSGL